MILSALAWVVLAQAASQPLAGTVIGPDGIPSIGAEVVVVRVAPGSEVWTRNRSAAGGKFTVDRPAVPAGEANPPPGTAVTTTLWVVQPGARLARLAVPPGDEPITVRLEGPGRAEVRVLGPDGQPAAGVRVWPEQMQEPFRMIPDLVADLAGATTGGDGRAVLDSVTAAELIYVDLVTPAHGMQGFRFRPDPSTPLVIRLRPVATWTGRLKAADSAHARGWRVRAWTRVAQATNPDPNTVGYVDTTTDEDGRFRLDPIALGPLSLELKPPGDRPVEPDLPAGLFVRAGPSEVVEIPLQPTSTITGRYVEQGTGLPVPGVSVFLTSLGASRPTVQPVPTDAQGRYSLRSLPGLVRVQHLGLPGTHIEGPYQGWADFTVPELPGVMARPDHELVRAAPPVRGRVVDAADRPVAGAAVEARWQVNRGNVIQGGLSRGTTNERGEFSLGSIGPDSTVSVSAALGTRAGTSPKPIAAGDPDLVTVVIRPVPVIAVAGRLVGPDGVGLGGVEVTVQHREPQNGFAGFGQPVRFADNRPVRSGPDGTFRAPPEVERRPGAYQVVVNDPGFLPAQTPWLPAPSAGDVLTLPDLAVRRVRGTREVLGRVLDRAGGPVAGALIRQAGGSVAGTFARADAEGRFRLGGVPAGSGLLIAQADGCRLGGASVGAGDAPVEIRLARQTEPPVARLATLPPALSRADERALGLALLDPVLLLARVKPPGGGLNRRVMPALARLDPDRVLMRSGERVAAEPLAALLAVVQRRAEDDPAGAEALIAADQDPAARVAGWLALAAGLPAHDRARRVSVLVRARADALRVDPPEIKVKWLGRIADRWLRLGEPNRARAVILDGRRALADLPGGQWFAEVEEFAEVLAVVDLAGARAIFDHRDIQNTSPPQPWTIAGHLNAAAVHLAALDPAAAEGLVVAPTNNDTGRPDAIIAIARRMAPVDLARARRVLDRVSETIHPGQPVAAAFHPYGLGRMAGALHATDPEAARRLLDEAFVGLARVAAEGGFGWWDATSAANLMAELLPIVERVDPDKLAERAWLAAEWHTPLTREPQRQQVEGLLGLALLLARYDRSIAAAVADPVIDRLPEILAAEADFYEYTAAIPAYLAAYDPPAVEALIRSLPEAARHPPARPNGQAAPSLDAWLRVHAAEVLGLPPLARTQAIGRDGHGSPAQADD